MENISLSHNTVTWIYAACDSLQCKWYDGQNWIIPIIIQHIKAYI